MIERFKQHERSEVVTRRHANDVVSVGVTTDMWTLINHIEQQIRGDFKDRVENFTVDFMMEMSK